MLSQTELIMDKPTSSQRDLIVDWLISSQQEPSRPANVKPESTLIVDQLSANEKE